MTTVVDASVVVDWVAADTALTLPAQRLLRSWTESEEALIGPRLLFEECLNALLTGVRRGRWSTVDADRSATLLSRLPIRIVDLESDRSRAWELARRYDNCPLYDMLYVAVAERHGEQLVTADERLLTRLAHLGWVVAPNTVLDALAKADEVPPDDPGEDDAG